MQNVFAEAQDWSSRRFINSSSIMGLAEVRKSPYPSHIHATDSLGGPGTIRSSKTKKELCSACQQPIIDRYIMRVMDNSWHEGCLTCSVCHIHLSHTCYSRDRKLYCKADYDK
ncbi:uncharacterized protein CDAR_612481 [Caerostris darwini]|uniref:LIM zinc-binding domain-containing protein n=1 Tax=Caerostris darwini TaxID=1538125 RepID=A0AAV4SI18_9ARAC|nr:uncharacterized protein CDAR_612481 [Caerostris darwini]